MSHLYYDKKKKFFSFYRRKVAPNRTRFKEARLVAYASLRKFSKYTYYLGFIPKLLQKLLSTNKIHTLFFNVIEEL